MAKLAFRKLATPSCVKLFTCRPLSLGGGANPFSFGSQCSKAENSMISLSAAPSCANSSTLSSAFLNTNSPSTLCWPLSLKPFDSQDRIYPPPKKFHTSLQFVKQEIAQEFDDRRLFILPGEHIQLDEWKRFQAGD